MSETDHIEDMTTVTISMGYEDANEMFATLVRARDGLRDAIRYGNTGDIGYFFGWLDAELTKLAQATPDKAKAMMHEELKAEADSHRVTSALAGTTPVSNPLGGGGRKPH